MRELPYVLPVPDSAADFAALVRGRPPAELAEAISRIRTYNHAKVAAGNLERLQVRRRSLPAVAMLLGSAHWRGVGESATRKIPPAVLRHPAGLRGGAREPEPGAVRLCRRHDARADGHGHGGATYDADDVANCVCVCTNRSDSALPAPAFGRCRTGRPSAAARASRAGKSRCARTSRSAPCAAKVGEEARCVHDEPPAQPLMPSPPPPSVCMVGAPEHHAGWPAAPVLLPLSVVAHLFPDTDLRHTVLTPLRVYAAECLGMAPVWTLRDAACGLFVATIMWRLHQRSQRFVPEAFVFLERALTLLLGASPAGGTSRPRATAGGRPGPGLPALSTIATDARCAHRRWESGRAARECHPRRVPGGAGRGGRPPRAPLCRAGDAVRPEVHKCGRRAQAFALRRRMDGTTLGCAARWSLLQATLRLAVAYVDLYSGHSAVTALLRPLTAALARADKQLKSFPPAVKVRRRRAARARGRYADANDSTSFLSPPSWLGHRRIWSGRGPSLPTWPPPRTAGGTRCSCSATSRWRSRSTRRGSTSRSTQARSATSTRSGSTPSASSTSTSASSRRPSASCARTTSSSPTSSSRRRSRRTASTRRRSRASTAWYWRAAWRGAGRRAARSGLTPPRCLPEWSPPQLEQEQAGMTPEEKRKLKKRK